MRIEGSNLQIFYTDCQCGDDPWVDIVLKTESFGKGGWIITWSHHYRGVIASSELDDHLHLIERFRRMLLLALWGFMNGIF
jgi:hypothetical protein